jgi:hypothetical protein
MANLRPQRWQAVQFQFAVLEDDDTARSGPARLEAAHTPGRGGWASSPAIYLNYGWSREFATSTEFLAVRLCCHPRLLQVLVAPRPECCRFGRLLTRIPAVPVEFCSG